MKNYTENVILYAARQAMRERFPPTADDIEKTVRDYIGLGCGHSIRCANDSDSPFGPYWFVHYFPSLQVEIWRSTDHGTDAKVISPSKFLRACKIVWEMDIRSGNAQLAIPFQEFTW